MSHIKGMICAAAIAALGVIATGCDDEDPVVDKRGVRRHRLERRRADQRGGMGYRLRRLGPQRRRLHRPVRVAAPSGFNTLDADANGLLSQAEWDSAVTNWDVNGDGYLSPGELLYY